MGGSAFEKAVMERLVHWAQVLRRHDRVVTIGLLISLLPLPPACFAGLAVSLMHRRLLRTGRLPASEAEWVRWATWLAGINSILALVVMAWLSWHLSTHAADLRLPFVFPGYWVMQHLMDLFNRGTPQGVVI